MATSRVRWNDAELKILANGFKAALAKKPTLSKLDALNKAQEKLPADRRREVASWAIVEERLSPFLEDEAEAVAEPPPAATTKSSGSKAKNAPPPSSPAAAAPTSASSSARSAVAEQATPSASKAAAMQESAAAPQAPAPLHAPIPPAPVMGVPVYHAESQPRHSFAQGTGALLDGAFEGALLYALSSPAVLAQVQALVAQAINATLAGQAPPTLLATKPFNPAGAPVAPSSSPVTRDESSSAATSAPALGSNETNEQPPAAASSAQLAPSSAPAAAIPEAPTPGAETAMAELASAVSTVPLQEAPLVLKGPAQLAMDAEREEPSAEVSIEVPVSEGHLTSGVSSAEEDEVNAGAPPPTSPVIASQRVLVVGATLESAELMAKAVAPSAPTRAWFTAQGPQTFEAACKACVLAVVPEDAEDELEDALNSFGLTAIRFTGNEEVLRAQVTTLLAGMEHHVD